MSTRYVWNRYEDASKRVGEVDDLPEYLREFPSGARMNSRAVATIYYTIYSTVEVTTDDLGYPEYNVSGKGAVEQYVVANNLDEAVKIYINNGQAIAFDSYEAFPTNRNDARGLYVATKNNSYVVAYNNGSAARADGDGVEVVRYTNIEAKGELLGQRSGTSQGPYPPCPAAPPGSW